jgi:photosystem II stability/assembly factor-like uncharacterized protein
MKRVIVVAAFSFALAAFSVVLLSCQSVFAQSGQRSAISEQRTAISEQRSANSDQRSAIGEGGDPDAEMLLQPVRIPSDSGVYHGLSSIPEEIRRSAPFARLMHEMSRRAGTAGTFDIEERIAAFEQSQRDLLRSANSDQRSANSEQPDSGFRIPDSGIRGSAGALSNGAHALSKGSDAHAFSKGSEDLFGNAWTNIGLIGNPPVYSGGCISAIAIDPSNANIMYAGATSGGVWKSTNAGSTWAALTDNVIPNLSIASLAIDPNHPTTIYAGTGNGYAGLDELTGTGLWKSGDGGATWKRIGTTTFSGTVVKVLVDPVKSNVVFASLYSGGTKGLYRSTDSGSSWSRVFQIGSSGVIWDVAAGTVIGGTPLIYFVAGNNISGGLDACGVYKSVDDGVTWSKISSSVLPAGGRIGRAGLAVSQFHPERVFCLMANVGGDTLGCYRSTDNGSAWGSVGIPRTLFKPFTTTGAQGWYDLAIAVSPYSSASHDTMFIGGVEGWVNRSDASGWVMFTGYNDQLPAGNPHVDIHCLAPRSGGSVVYTGCDGGLYWSTNQGSSWAYRSTGMVTNRFYHLGYDRSDYKTTWAGAQDQGTWKIVQGSSTALKLGGDGFQPIQSWGNASVAYGELPNGDVYRTVNSGTSWSLISSTFSDETNWDMPLVMGLTSLGSAPGYDVLLAGRQHLWRTTDAGDTWSTISGTFSQGDIVSIGISQVTEQNIYIGLRGAIYLSTNAGNSWTSKSSGVPGANVMSIVTTGRDPNFALAGVYTSGAGRVIVTTNQGTSWSSVVGASGAALPNVGVNSVALDSVNPKTTWYAATDNGIYYTRDAGQHWSIAGAGLGLAPCRDVQVHPNKITIRVATFGRGIWEANANILPVELSSLEYEKTSFGTKLLWHTDSERGNSGFFIERSIDGNAFEEIAFTPGHGTTDTRQDYAYVDALTSPGTYLYQLKQVDLDGTEHFSNHVEVHYGNTQTIVYQAYPNPFLLGTPYHDLSNFLGADLSGVSPALETRFRFELPDADDDVSLRLYDARGTVVATLLDHTSQQAGQVDAFWNGTASDGGTAAAGTYFWTLETRSHGSFTNKLILIHK